MAAESPAQPAAADGDLIPLGKIIGTHALRGEVRLYPFNQKTALLTAKQAVCLRRGDDVRTATIAAARHQRTVFVLRLDGCESIAAAEALVGFEVCVPRTVLPPAGPNEIYHFDLIGMHVVTVTGDILGSVEEIMEGAGADICVVRGERGEFLIPMIADVVHELDRVAKRLVITPIPGLLDP